jgi:hypothetical protein
MREPRARRSISTQRTSTQQADSSRRSAACESTTHHEHLRNEPDRPNPCVSANRPIGRTRWKQPEACDSISPPERCAKSCIRPPPSSTTPDHLRGPGSGPRVTLISLVARTEDPAMSYLDRLRAESSLEAPLVPRHAGASPRRTGDSCSTGGKAGKPVPMPTGSIRPSRPSPPPSWRGTAWRSTGASPTGVAGRMYRTPG